LREYAAKNAKYGSQEEIMSIRAADVPILEFYNKNSWNKSFVIIVCFHFTRILTEADGPRGEISVSRKLSLKPLDKTNIYSIESSTNRGLSAQCDNGTHALRVIPFI